MTLPLTIDRLRRIQATLTRRIAPRDSQNIVAVGFSPASRAECPEPKLSLPIKAQFDVLRKQKTVPEKRRIAAVEAVRLLDRQTKSFDEISLPTGVQAVRTVVPTGVRIQTEQEHATTSLIVRWTKAQPVPALPQDDDWNENPAWRWGVLTVAHLFAYKVGTQTPVPRARVRRVAHCDVGPSSISGRLVARGKVPGGPDLALVETGLDRLWLSGFLPRVASAAIAVASENELVRWTSAGTQGSYIGTGVPHRWRWQTFYPELKIDGLGRLVGIVRYEYLPASHASDAKKPFGPGASGGVVVAGGIPIGVQVAAMHPEYRVGYAQTFWATLPWLKKKLAASALEIAHVVTASSHDGG